MSRDPLVSVVVLNHDYARFLRDAIGSALAQTYEHVEVVVVDDGSTDGSVAVIRSYGDAVVPVFKRNGGQTSAINAGFRASGGELVCFLDADDALAPEALEAAIPPFEDPSVVKVHWPLREIDESGAPGTRLWPREPLAEGDLLETVIARGPANCAFAPMSGNLFSRPFLDRVMPLPELEPEVGMGGACPDAYLAMLAAVEGSVASVPRALGLYRVHGGNGFAGRDQQRTIDLMAGIYDRQFELLAERLRARGTVVDTDSWRRQSWFHRLDRVRREIATLVGPGRTCALVDDELTGLLGAAGGRIVRLFERDGEYWGPPADGRQAIAEVERARESGVDAVAIAWVARWWLDAFPELLEHLTRHYARSLETDLLVAFDLTRAPARSSARPVEVPS